MRLQGVSDLWPDARVVIGMVHLGPLPGAPGWGGSMASVLDQACTDAQKLSLAGFDALVVENYSDSPFLRGPLPAETIASLCAAVSAVEATVTIPVGVNALRNDARAALGIAVATGAAFIRVNVHTGSMWTDQGLVEGAAGETLRIRAALDADVAILADVQVKHATPPVGASLAEASSDAWERGLADGLIVSGRGTGQTTDHTHLNEVHQTVPAAPLFAGSGVTADNVGRTLEVATGVIVGSSIMCDGIAGHGVDTERASAFMRAVRGCGLPQFS